MIPADRWAHSDANWGKKESMPHTLLRRLLMSLGCLSGLVAAPLGQAAPLGDPVMVNTATAGNQRPIYFSA
ncbi:hypothetical protein, partial [Variovorax beijingensis]|uniref:hypothetical protein n=1 Tax=Variovorax beijingensis TaxID=2496117 RepID=UPI003F699071